MMGSFILTKRIQPILALKSGDRSSILLATKKKNVVLSLLALVCTFVRRKTIVLFKRNTQIL